MNLTLYLKIYEQNSFIDCKYRHLTSVG